MVNRLLFPYLFNAVELMTETGMPAADVDRCMALGAGMPMGPLALLDFVGLDVSMAIGEAIGADIPRSSSTWSTKARSDARASAGSSPTSEKRGRSVGIEPPKGLMVFRGTI